MELSWCSRDERLADSETSSKLENMQQWNGELILEFFSQQH